MRWQERHQHRLASDGAGLGRLGHGSWRWSHGSARAVLYRLGHHGPVSADPGPISEFIGVYDADGGLVGEASYLVGKILGRRHCSLCDITHSPVRRKKQWDTFVASLPVPFRLYHLNEMPADVAQAVATHGSPVVLERSGPQLRVLLGPAELEDMHGSVDEFAHRFAQARA